MVLQQLLRFTAEGVFPVTVRLTCNADIQHVAFLRELITDPNKIEHQPDSFMKIVSDKTNSNVSIEDSGIGMTKNEFVYTNNDDEQDTWASAVGTVQNDSNPRSSVESRSCTARWRINLNSLRSDVCRFWSRNIVSSSGVRYWYDQE